jgi:hypothetical protein
MAFAGVLKRVWILLAVIACGGFPGSRRVRFGEAQRLFELDNDGHRLRPEIG